MGRTTGALCAPTRLASVPGLSSTIMNTPAPQRAYNPEPQAPTTESDDRLLVARVVTGDQRALAQLYDRWSQVVFGLVMGLLRDGDEAEDIVEDCFWQVWRQAARYDPSRGEVSVWLLTIARSRSLDRLRSCRRRGEEALTPALLDTVDARDAGDRDDPGQATERSDRRRRVVDALRLLPTEQRQVLELAYFAGLTQTEIAERTGWALGTVKTRARLALEKLRGSLAMLRDLGGADPTEAIDA